MTIKLRDYQNEAVASIFRYFGDWDGHPLVVAPTGSGKSVIIAGFISEIYRRWSDQRILVLQHRKELIEQNFSKLCKMCDSSVSLGLYSAGLGVKQINRKVIVAGVQSLYRATHKLDHIDLVLIDEAHLIPPDGAGMYRTILDALTARNPDLRAVGFTATPFRMTTGALTDDDGIFTDICYNADMRRLIKDKRLVPLISKAAENTPDTSEIKIKKGEFVQEEVAALYTEKLSRAVIQEFRKHGAARKSVLVFCSGVDHAEYFTQLLRESGESAECITGTSESLFRDQHIGKFKRGEIRFLVNVDVLTTGFDAPNVDCIMVLRSTQSPGLWVQICGRGMRTHEGKDDCLVLDFGGNIERHGPIDQIQVQRKARRKEGTNEYEVKNEVTRSTVKICNLCRAAMPLSSKSCTQCGAVLLEVKHEETASSGELISGGEKKVEVEVFTVNRIEYLRHLKEGKPDSMKIIYHYGFRKHIQDFLFFSHTGYAREKSIQLWKMLAVDPEAAPPNDTDEALFLATTGELKPVELVKCEKDGKFWRIRAYKFKQEGSNIDFNSNGGDNGIHRHEDRRTYQSDW